jgi:hypothetical protein
MTLRNGGVIEYRCKDGDTTYYIQYRDSTGRQVKETLGRKSEGWTLSDARTERKNRILYVRESGFIYEPHRRRRRNLSWRERFVAWLRA